MNMRSIGMVLLMVLALAWMPLRSDPDEGAGDPPAPSDEGEASDGIPYTPNRYHLVYVPVTVNGEERYFMLDTGTAITRIFRSFLGPSGFLQGGRGRQGTVSGIRIGDYEIENAAAIPEQDIPFPEAPGPLGGVLGNSFLEDTVLVVDSREHVVRVLEEVPDEVKRWTETSFEWDDGAPLVQIRVNGTAPQWVALDSGANTCVTYGRFAAAMGLDPADHPEAPTGRMRSARGALPAKQIEAETLAIGDVVLTGVPFFVPLDGAMPWGPEERMAGNLGGTALHRLRWCIDYANRKVYWQAAEEEAAAPDDGGE